jgi:hypothetical protein
MRDKSIGSEARRKARRWPIGSGTIAALLLLAVVAAMTKPPPVSGDPAHPPPTGWVEVQQPARFFNLNAPEFPRSTLTYQARRHWRGGGRQDILTLGKLDGQEPYVRLVLYRVGREPVPPATLFVALVQMAASAGLSITRSLTSEEVATRFGDFETADVDLAAGAGAPVQCLGFRTAALDGKFLISGFACGVASKPLSRVALACLLDRLDLNSTGDDSALAGFFAATELWHDPVCAGTGLAPMLLKTNWIDQDGAPPPLRMRKRH